LVIIVPFTVVQDDSTLTVSGTVVAFTFLFH
jgi:hypothetical protein